MKRTALKRKTPLKRGKGLAKVGKHRKPIQAQYVKQRTAFLEKAAATGCQAGIECGLTPGKAQDVHHKQGRAGKLLLDETKWIAVCRRCHDWIHDNPKEATDLGLLIPR